jgi:hypothetical protein
MKNKTVLSIAAALALAPFSVTAAPADTQVLIAVSLPKGTSAEFRKYLEEPGRRAALEACKETTNDAESSKLKPDFPRPLKPKERKLFERLLFTCTSPSPDVFANFSAASQEVAAATGSPLASTRIVFDTIPNAATPRSAAKAACRVQRCYSGELRYTNDLNTCTCK